MPQPSLAGRRSRSDPRARCRFLFHRDESGSAGGSCPSAGVSALRPTGGEVEQVTGGVYVPVLLVPAVLARVSALLEGQLGFHCPAGRARFRTREPAVRRDQRPAVPRGLVAEHPPGLAEPLVGDRAGELPVTGHPGHVQVLGHDRLVPARQVRRRLVQCVRADVRDAGVNPGEARGRLPRVRRALLPAGVRTAGAAQFPHTRAERLRAVSGNRAPLIVHPGQQGLNAEVDTHGRPGPGMRLRHVPPGFDRERHEPPLSGP